MAIHPQQPIFCKPHFCRVEAGAALSSLSEVISCKSHPAILGGNESVTGHSIFTAEPLEVFEFSLNEDQPFEKLNDFLSNYPFADGGGVQTGIFPGGWIGYFGYELGRYIEKLPCTTVDDLGFPVIRLGFYDKAILFNHQTGRFTLMALDCDGQDQRASQKFTRLNAWLDEAKKTSVSVPDAVDLEAVTENAMDCNMTRQTYLDSLAKIKHYIIEGDTYQINFSQRFCTDFKGRGIDLFHWQNTYNPSPYAGYLAWDGRAVVSASPELFLQVADETTVTKPIKGTRPRNPLLSDESAENAKHFHDLVTSEKDQAELAMIVDLERNDLARICRPGTRFVSCAREIEAFPTVYHAIATVQGQLALPPGPRRIIEILRATFPGGSITGAPKIRSMEIIDELEPTARGVYTGSIGWIGLNFDLCWNIAIRTILVSGQKATVQAGGGIVADSDARAEWCETITKARALLASIEAVTGA